MADCTPRCFGDGIELVTHLAHCLDGRLPNLIILDWHMPRLGGAQVLQLLRQDHQWHPIPIVVRSGCGQDAAVSRSYELGARAFILKVGHYQQLVESVNALRYYGLN